MTHAAVVAVVQKVKWFWAVFVFIKHLFFPFTLSLPIPSFAPSFQFLESIFIPSSIICLQGYAALYDSFEQFYLRYVYRRIRDCFNRPICSVPGDEVTLKDRITKDFCWTFE